MLSVFLGLLLITSLSSQVLVPEKIEISDNEERILEIKSYDSKDYLITVPTSYKLLVDIENINLISEYGDYLLVKRGPDFDAVGTGLVLTEKGLPETKSIMVSSQQTYLQLYLGPPVPPKVNVSRSFRVKLKASGTSVIITTESPTTSSTWPTPGAGDKIHFKAHISGRHDYEYIDPVIIADLRAAIARMANKYCTEQQLPLVGTISSRNVLISDLIRCPYSWPQSDDCVILNFALPVVMQDAYDEYQLQTKHLQVMWERYNSELDKLGLKDYVIPDLEKQMVGWGVAIGLTVGGLVIAIVTIVALREFRPSTFMCHKKHMEEDQHDILEEERRDSYVPNEAEFDKFSEFVNTSRASRAESERTSIHGQFSSNC